MKHRNRYPIPPNTPYDGPGRFFMMCLPDDPLWITAVSEAVRKLTVGRTWDEDTGVITDAMATGREIWNSMIDCSLMLDKMDAVVAAINALTAATSAQTLCCDAVDPPNPPDPPPSPIPPNNPDPPDIPPAYGGDPAAYDAELCRMANALHWQIRKWLDFLKGLEFWSAALALLVSLALILFPEPASTAIGGVTLATILGYAMGISGGLDTLAAWAEGALVVWDNAQQSFVCFVYGVIGGSSDWKDQIVDEIVATLESAGGVLPGDKAVRFFVGWLVGFMDYFDSAIYGFTASLESHANPVSCECNAPCNDCSFNKDGTLSAQAGAFQVTGDLTQWDNYRVQMHADGERFAMLALGGGFQAGRISFPDTENADCAYCVAVTISGTYAQDRFYCAKFTDSTTFNTSEVDPANILTVPAGTYDHDVFEVPIDEGGNLAHPLTLGIKSSQQSHNMNSVRVRWKE